MNILRLIDSMDPLTGGPCQGIRNSIAELVKIGVHNEVACLDDPSAPYLGKDPFTIHALGPHKGPWHYSYLLLPWLRENLTRFDVLIVHGLWLYTSFTARVMIRNLAKRAVNEPQIVIPKLFVMPHGMLDPYFQNAATRRLKAIRNWLFWKLVEHKVVRDANGLLFTSETELRMARIAFRPYQPKLEINIGYGIQPPPAYSPAMQAAFQKCCPTLNNEPYLLFLSRIHEKKGVDLLINAYISVLKMGFETVKSLPKLVIAGPGFDTPYGQVLRELVDRNPELTDRILFPGMLDGLAKWGAFYNCDAFVLPSHQENFGIAVAESLACGKPVLISNQINIWHEIESGQGGIIADNTLSGTQQLLLQWLRIEPVNKREMRERAKEIFEQYFAITQAAQRLKKAISLNSA